MICVICGEDFNPHGNHLRKEHGLTSQEYFDQYLATDMDGKCVICGKPTQFRGIKVGYKKHCSTKCAQSDIEVINTKKAVFLEKYGGMGTASTIIKDKIEATNLEKYGVKNIFTRPDISEKAHSKTAREKQQQTMMTKYGTKSIVSQKMIDNTHTKDCIDKQQESIRKTNQEKYGINSLFQNTEFQQKCHEVKKQKGWTSEHKTETKCYDYVLSRFPDAIREYSSEEYPFPCDFYVPSEDLYIELNVFWTHGGHYFDKNDINDVKKLEIWKAKNTKNYDYAIRVWTVKDLEKKHIAEKNNLNYLVFWSVKELKDFCCKINLNMI